MALLHEPWRDEAQAWLVATSATSLYDLLVRSSAEASGPVYYLLLRPWALYFPNAFPGAVFFVSFFGTALFALVFSRTPWVPPLWRGLVLFGYLFGYEYSCISRLYGWGCFFFWMGICRDRKGQQSGLVWLGLSILTQLSFLFAVIGWVAYRWRTGQSLKRYLALAVPLLLLAWHTALGAPLRNWGWVPWVGVFPFFNSLGTTLIAPLLHGPRLDAYGILVFCGLLLALTPPARLGFAAAMMGFIALFVFRYKGTAEVRHGGALFLLFLSLASESKSTLPGASRWIAVLLVANCLTGLGVRFQDYRRNFGDGLSAAVLIDQKAKALKRPVRLYAHKREEGFVIAAKLGVPIWVNGLPVEMPFFPQLPETSRPDLSFEKCVSTFYCVHAQNPAEPVPGATSVGTWSLLFKATQSIREPISVYEFTPTPLPSGRF